MSSARLEVSRDRGAPSAMWYVTRWSHIMSDSPLLDLENPTEEHRMLRQMARDFARTVLEPQADEQDRKGHLNVALMRRVGELGLHGITIPASDGGAGLDALAAAIVHHEFSKSDPGFCLAYL